MGDDLVAPASAEEALFGDVARLIDGARTRAAASVNSELVTLYWSVGKRVREEVLGGERAQYGERVVGRLAERLTERYGRGWSRRNLERMIHFAEWLPSAEKCETLSPKLSWSHFFELLAIPDQQKRDFTQPLRCMSDGACVLFGPRSRASSMSALSPREALLTASGLTSW